MRRNQIHSVVRLTHFARPETSLQLFFLILIPSLAFGGWPILGKKLGLSEAWTNVTLVMVTIMIIGVYYAPSLQREDVPSADKLGKMVAIGVLNAIGMLAFGPLMRIYPQYIPIAQIGMPTIGFLGGIFILGITPDWRQVAFSIVALIGIAGMSYYTPR